MDELIDKINKHFKRIRIELVAYEDSQKVFVETVYHTEGRHYDGIHLLEILALTKGKDLTLNKILTLIKPAKL